MQLSIRKLFLRDALPHPEVQTDVPGPSWLDCVLPRLEHTGLLSSKCHGLSHGLSRKELLTWLLYNREELSCFMIVINCQLIKTILNWTHRCLLWRLNLCLLQQSDTDHGVWPYLIGQSLPDWSLLYRTHVQEWDIPTSANCMPNCNLPCPFGKHIPRSSSRVKFTARLEQLFGLSRAFLRSGILGSGRISNQGSWRTHALSLNLSANLAPAGRLRGGRRREWSYRSVSLQICQWLKAKFNAATWVWYPRVLLCVNAQNMRDICGHFQSLFYNEEKFFKTGDLFFHPPYVNYE